MKVRRLLATVLVVCLLAVSLSACDFESVIGWLTGNLNYCAFEIKDGEAALIYVDVAAEGKLSVPSNYMGFPVTAIGDYAFENCGALTEVTIPEGVKTIGEDAFSNCVSLESITLPEGLTSIGERAFPMLFALRTLPYPIA